MYRLTYFKGVNLLGIYSGLGKKTFELDLTDLSDKEIIVICGDNGSGKSTFLSLIHPWPYPTDGRTKFIIKGKEGSLIRKYTGEDGTIFTSQCIYTPKKDGGHNSKCYLKIEKPGCDPVELNPNGNVASYMQLLYTYFGINKDFLAFASYSTEIASIVNMTDSERKSSVDTMVPNVRRYEVAYNILNEKYKNLRNLIRNVAQKIVSLRDEDSLEADFHRLTDELKKYTNEREDHIKKLARIEGRLKELTATDDVNTLIDRYNAMVVNLASYDSDITRVYRKLMKLYDELGIEPERKGSISFPAIDSVPSFIIKYEKKIVAAEGSLTGYKNRMEQLQRELHQVEKNITETESVLYSIQTQDVEELQQTRKGYVDQLKSLRYTGQKQFEDMSYDEAVNFSRTVVAIDHMIHALYDEYGDIVTVYFGSDDWSTYAKSSEDYVVQLDARIQTTTAKKDQLYRQIMEKQNYQQLSAILKQRPKSCTIDNCPFIATALKYENIIQEIQDLSAQYEQSCITLADMEKDCDEAERRLAIHSDAQKLIQYIQANAVFMDRYLGIHDLSALYKAIANGTWGKYLDIMRLKDIASILSEKELYLQITMQRLPEIDHAIELAKAYGSNRDILMHQLDQLNSTQSILRAELDEHRMHIKICESQSERYATKLTLWKAVAEGIDQYRSLITAQLETQEQVSEQDERIKRIKELTVKSKEQKAIIEELDDLIRSRNPKREQIKLDLDAVRRLKIEHLEIEREFTVINIIRSLVTPGKGIRRELIDIYMYDICTIANQLLLNTFDGKLYLKEFMITDKEFIIPYVYNGAEGSDISFASAAQKSTIASAINLAILSKLVSKYGIYTGDEQDGPLNPKNKREFIPFLLSQMRYVGIIQAFIISQEPNYYEPYDVGVVCFPGGEVSGSNTDVIYV